MTEIRREIETPDGRTFPLDAEKLAVHFVQGAEYPPLEVEAPVFLEDARSYYDASAPPSGMYQFVVRFPVRGGPGIPPIGPNVSTLDLVLRDEGLEATVEFPMPRVARRRVALEHDLQARLDAGGLDRNDVFRAAIQRLPGRGGQGQPFGSVGRPVAQPGLVEDIGLAGSQIMLQAKSLGLGTCWVGGVDAAGRKQIAAILKLPEHLEVVGLLTVGFPAEDPPPPARKPLTEIVHYDVYGNQAPGSSATPGRARGGALSILLRRLRLPLRV
jgi:hypothetical protein